MDYLKRAWKQDVVVATMAAVFTVYMAINDFGIAAAVSGAAAGGLLTSAIYTLFVIIPMFENIEQQDR